VHIMNDKNVNEIQETYFSGIILYTSFLTHSHSANKFVIVYLQADVHCRHHACTRYCSAVNQHVL